MNGQIIEKDGKKYKVIEIIENNKDERLLFWEKWSDEKQCLRAVEQNGYALRYVKEQTEAICLEAVKQDGYVLQYVKEQTEAICLEAVKQDGDALQYVKEQT